MSKKDDINKSRFGIKDLLIILIFLFITFCGVCLFWLDLNNTIKLQNVEPVGIVVVKRNVVQRRITDRVLWDRLARESPVYIGDLIRIAEQSEAYLEINGNTIELEENSLIRIVPSPDGEGFMIQVSSGSISVIQHEDSKPIFIEVEGKPIQAQPGVVFTATVTDIGSSVEEVAVSQWIEARPQLTAPAQDKINLISPAINSLFRYHDDLPEIKFRWEEKEDAVAYVFELSNNYTFFNPLVSTQTTTASNILKLREGTWYWRVRPVYYSVNGGYASYSDTSYFRVTENAVHPEEDLSFSEWITMESPLNQEVPPGVPLELVPAVLRTPEPPPPPPPPPPPVRTAPPPPRIPQPVRPPPPAPAPPPSPPPAPTPIVPLQAPRIIQPVNNSTIGLEQLRARRSITFSWAPIQDANAYIFTLVYQTADGQQEIIRTEPIASTYYTINNLRMLNRGTFVWHVEAVTVVRTNVIERRGNVSQNTFNIDYPLPTPIIIDDIGVLYGE